MDSQKVKGLPIGIQWVAVLAVIALGIFVAALPLLPTIQRHSHQNYQFHRRSVQLRSICQGLIVIARNNRNNLPGQDEWQEVLVSTGVIESAMLVSPLSNGVEASYVLVPNRGLSMDPSELMLYENPKHDPKGVFVAFMDGRVEMVNHEVFKQLLADLRSDE